MNKKIWYLASPYTNYCQGREAAYIEVCKVAAKLLKDGMFVFSPVAHSHPIATLGNLDPVDHNFWLALDVAILDECDGLLVLQMPGWKESQGISAEIEHAKKTHKFISYLSWPMLNVREDEGGRDLQ